MTVLPNAPIDAATGLPVPTIAVATDGGVSVIKDDGTVVDITRSQGTSYPKVEITSDGKLFYNSMTGDYWHVIDIPTSDINDGTVYYQKGQSEQYYGGNPAWLGDLQILGGTSGTGIGSSGNQLMLGTTKALNRIESNPDAPSTGMTNFTTSTYNTGWMNGDIKLATLSDTDDTDVTGSELVTNGDFSSTLGAEWDLSTGSGTIAIVSGQLEITQGGSSSVMYASQDFTTVSGKTYTLSFKVVATTEANYFRVKVGTYANATNLGVTSTLTAAGEYSITFTATGSTSWVTLHSDQNANKKTTWDNVSVRLAEEDRSVNANGLQVFGTVTKNPVATGADLVAYSGFSAQ
jgi:trimeric autotransporter adhesin